MTLLYTLLFAVSAAVALWCGPGVLIAVARISPAFEPPSCYVCGHHGPVGELVPKLPCCIVCREAVTRELDAILDPLKEARDQEERRLAEARSVTDFATKFGMLPPGGLEAQMLAMHLGVPIDVLQGQGRKAIVARHLHAKQDGAAQGVLDAIARLAARS